jgi:hypothetical protein
MTGRTPAARVPAARSLGAGLRPQPAPSRWYRAMLMAMWQMLVSLGAVFVPPPVWPDDVWDDTWDDTAWDDTGWHDARWDDTGWGGMR